MAMRNDWGTGVVTGVVGVEVDVVTVDVVVVGAVGVVGLVGVGGCVGVGEGVVIGAIVLHASSAARPAASLLTATVTS